MTTPHSTDLPTFEEALDSLTGYDEIAIEKRFGGEIYTLLTASSVKASRALAYVLNKRTGLDDAAAYKAAMGLTLTQLNASFADEPDEPLADEPVTEVGKDATPNA